MSPLEWLKFILLKPEDEVLALLDKHPELAELPIKIECSISDDGIPCKCFEKYELISSVDMTTGTFWLEYVYAVSKGVCHHVATGNQRLLNYSVDSHRHELNQEPQSNQNGTYNFTDIAPNIEILINKATSTASVEPPIDQAISQRNSYEPIEHPVNQDIQRNTELLELQKNKDILERVPESVEPSGNQDICQRNFVTKEPPLNQNISQRHSETQEPVGVSKTNLEIMEPPDDQVITQRNSVTLELPVVQTISDGDLPRTLENLEEKPHHHKTKMNFTVRDLKDLKLNENDLEHDLEDPTRSVQPESHTAAVYSIHIAVILNKQKIIEKVLPSTQDLEKNPKLWRRLITWHNMASPLYLSIVSKNKSIFCYILQNCTHLLHHRGLHHNTVLGTASASNSVDFLQLAFAGCDKKTEMIGHLELPYMYDLGNCLSCAVESRALDSLKLLIAKGASKYLAFNKYLELSEKLIKADDMETFAIFIDDKDAQNMSDVLIQIIEYDRPRLATVLLETIARLESIKRPSPVLKCSNGKQKKSIGFLNEQIPFLIYSMITNAENVARVLIADDKKYLSKYGQYKQYSASDWTVILGKNDLELCIKQRYGNTAPNTKESVQNESAIVAALKLNFRPMICVRKLIDQGFNLNDITSENETAFSVSVKQQTIGRTPEVRNQLVRFLLKNGADPFKGCMAMKSFPCRGNDPFSTVIMKSYLNFRIIPEILYAGADISRSTLVNALVQNFKNPAASKMLVLILKTGCKITQQQKNLLTQLQFKKGLDEELAEQIHLFLNEFPNLFSVCRNSIRSFCGTNLQFFISNSELPNKIKNALLFSDVFEQYTLYP